MKVLEFNNDSGDLSWKCILAQQYRTFLSESRDHWYLWWFIGDKDCEHKDCVVIRFSVDCEMYMDHAWQGASCQGW